jgi:hypothetical protein
VTKKDFIIIADALREARRKANMNAGGIDMNAGTYFATLAIADALSLHYERFKKERWLAYVAGTCGPSGGKRKK